MSNVNHPLVELARQTIATYLRDGKQVEPPSELPPDLPKRAGAFVSPANAAARAVSGDSTRGHRKRARPAAVVFC